jgi:hypothetical protein
MDQAMSDEAPKIPRSRPSIWPAVLLIGTVVIALCGIGAAIHATWAPSHNFPQQAQASAMAVPTPTYKYQSAVVFQSCHMLMGVIFVDDHGKLHPVNPKTVQAMDLKQALQLLAQAPASATISVETPCKKLDTNGTSQPI